MTAPDPQRAVAEARREMDEALIEALACWPERSVGRRDVLRLWEKSLAYGALAERARLLATQDDADAHAPGYHAEGRRDP